MSHIELNTFFEINQPIGTFYIAKITPAQLKRISKDNLSRYEDKENGIQRGISIDRKKEIQNYIKNNPDATFPGTFIIAVSGETKIQSDKILIPDKSDEAYILDGQHRLAGFDELEENFEIVVAIFRDIERYSQAMIFATINGKQSRVDPSLVYDLFELSKKRSCEKVSHDIVKLLNENDSSAWKGKIKMLGRGDGIISQSAMIKEFIKLLDKGVFSSFYKQDEDGKIYKILENYFNAMKNTFSQEFGNKEYILSKTTGFSAFMSFFSDLYNIAKVTQQSLIESFFIEKLELTKTGLKPLTSTNYVSGARGQAELYNDLKKSIS